MPNPQRDFDAALGQIADRWDGARSERTLNELHLARARRARLAARSAALGVLLMAGAGAALWSARESPAKDLRAQAPDRERHMQLSDGSQIDLVDAATQLRVEDAPGSTQVALSAGRARFDVTHRARVFRVVCGEVIVEVLGTAFELERDGARTRVAVTRGRVAVHWRQITRVLAAGEAGWFPQQLDATVELDEAAPKPTAAERSDMGLAAQSSKRNARKSASSPSARGWREPAEQGDFERAYELLAHSPQPSADDVEELLLAADAARLSGHPQAALPYLKQVVTRHPRDSRAALASFTLGGVLMQQLGQPREAEAAYARARELSLNSSLAEDALARQVEAAHRAGDAAHARTLAGDYLTRYPQGRRVHAVQRFGGLLPK